MCVSRTKFLVTHRGQDREQRMRMDTVWTREECLDSIKLTGAEICAKALVPMATSYDAPLFPFTGPISIEVMGHKRDTHDKLHMEFTFEHEKVNGPLSHRTTFTPQLHLKQAPNIKLKK